jgi:hypothetical protein
MFTKIQLRLSLVPLKLSMAIYNPHITIFAVSKTRITELFT